MPMLLIYVISLIIIRIKKYFPYKRNIAWLKKYTQIVSIKIQTTLHIYECYIYFTAVQKKCIYSFIPPKYIINIDKNSLVKLKIAK